MEKHLAMLKRDGLIQEWHDRKILPGQDFRNEIHNHLDNSDIILLLLSADFLASRECMLEVDRSVALMRSRHTTVVPIILRPCAWKDLGSISSLLALPTDAVAVTNWNDADSAFLNIYQNIKPLLTAMTPKLRPSCREELTEIEFVSQGNNAVQLEDLFVFPNIIHDRDRVEMAKGTRNTRGAIKDFPGLWQDGSHVLLTGDDKSGKTVLCRKLFLHVVDNDAPVLLLQGLKVTSRVNHEKTIAQAFQEQFSGNYEHWKNRPNKTLIIDDFNNNTPLAFVEYAQSTFRNILIAVSNDEYLSYFRDDTRVASFEVLRLRSLTHVQQERLIKRWAALGPLPNGESSVGHGLVDQIEDRLNSIILHDKIVPRYPFYVLSILQTYEAFMPRDLQITTHGHCYQSLITANLIWNGIHSSDIDSCFNFLGCLAFDLFQKGSDVVGETEFRKFVTEYKQQYVIKPSVLARMTERAKSLVKLSADKCCFRYRYIYYFFLGYNLARNGESRRSLVTSLAENSHVRDNAFVLMFLVHHTHDDSLIRMLASQAIAGLEAVGAATLRPEETRLLEEALEELPEHILTDHSVESAREAERAERDRVDGHQRTEAELGGRTDDETNFRALKNMEILGQILKNRYGSLSRAKLEEVVGVISEAGFCLIADSIGPEGIRRLEDFLTEMARDRSMEESAREAAKLLSGHVRAIVVLFILGFLGKTVECLQKPELD